MCSPDVAFALPPDVRPRDVLDRVASAEATRDVAEEPVERTYLDTFDWRLLRAGLVLVEEREAGRRLLWLAANDEAPARSLRRRRPAFVRDLPEGWLRERLAPVVGARRLLPRVLVAGSAHGLALIDGEERAHARVRARVPVRVMVETVTATLPDGPRVDLPAVVRVERPRGSAGEAERLRSHLAAMPGLLPLAGGALERALRALGAWPARDPSRPDVALHPTMPADRALRALLRAELAVIRANERGVIEDLDVEFLHDLRVACRRSRALLGELGHLLDADRAAAAREDFRWLGTRTGPLRDLDVFLANQASWGAELEPLERAARRLRRRALRDVRKALRSKRYGALIESWRVFLDEEPRLRPGDGDGDGDGGDSAAEGAPAIASAARERVRARAARVAKRGRKLGPDTPAEKVHRLRLLAKKLRYLLDAFGAVLEPDGAKSVRRRLRRLQDALGRFNDAQIEIALLDRLAADMDGHAGSTAALLAMGRRQAELDGRMRRARKRLARRVAKLTGDPELERLCAPRDADGG